MLFYTGNYYYYVPTKRFCVKSQFNVTVSDKLARLQTLAFALNNIFLVNGYAQHLLFNCYQTVFPGTRENSCLAIVQSPVRLRDD